MRFVLYNFNENQHFYTDSYVCGVEPCHKSCFSYLSSKSACEGYWLDMQQVSEYSHVEIMLDRWTFHWTKAPDRWFVSINKQARKVNFIKFYHWTNQPDRWSIPLYKLARQMNVYHCTNSHRWIVSLDKLTRQVNCIIGQTH